MPKVASRADQLIAYRAILCVPGLSPGERAVGCAILSHFNEDTGQCDPGVARLAAMVGVKRDTVFAAVAKLQALGILSKTTYGGKSHRNSYAIDWDRCAEIDKANNRPHRGTVKPSRQPSPDRDGEPSPDGDTNGYLLKRGSSPRRRKSASGSVARGSSGGSLPDPQGFLVHAFAGGKQGAGAKAAEGAEQRRLARSIEKLRTPEEREAAWLRAMGEP
jgi:hypothetical protein